MNRVFLFCTLCLLSLTLHAQSYGGEIKLKITYNDRPLVGYAITGSINDIDIGGKGVTDRHGNVTLHSDPLPIPNIDVKGVSNCGNTTREWEASGFVYVSPSENNYFHLRLDQVAKQMSEMSGLDMSMIMASFGLSCDGALGSKEDGAVPHPKAGKSGGSSSASTSSGSSSSGGSLSSSDSDSFGSSSDDDDDDWERRQAERKAETDKEFAEWEAKNEAKREERKKEQEQFHEDVMSGKARQDGLQNQRTALINGIARIEKKMGKNEDELASGKLKEKDRVELEWDQKELGIEKQIKENKLARTEMEISKGDGYPSRAEKTPYKERDEKLKAELDAVKKERKQSGGILKVKTEKEASSSDDAATSTDDAPASDEIMIDGTPISQVSDRDLKTERLGLRSKVGKLKLKLKTKGKNMSDAEKAELENEIAETQKVIDAINERLD